MNTKIARALIEAGKKGGLKKEGERIVTAHNIAVANGFQELPMLEYVTCDDYGATIELTVNSRSGAVMLDDLYNIKHAWGADGVMVYTCKDDDGRIGLTFKKV